MQRMKVGEHTNELVEKFVQVARELFDAFEALLAHALSEWREA